MTPQWLQKFRGVAVAESLGALCENDIEAALAAHADLLTGLRTIGQYLDEGQIVTARAMVDDLLAKHGGEE